MPVLFRFFKEVTEQCVFCVCFLPGSFQEVRLFCIGVLNKESRCAFFPRYFLLLL